MPRPRRPPGAGPALTLLTLLLLPSLLVAAQQQHHHRQVHSPSPYVEPLLDTARRPIAAHDPNANANTNAKAHVDTPQGSPGDAKKRWAATPLQAQHARAVATKVSSAPAFSAVRASSRNTAASGALVPSARSLQDWEVEDFVLLATVDGHIHARDRYNGEYIWHLPGRPMLETIYNLSNAKNTLEDQPFVWIVEPREDGALYVLTPGPYPVLQSLGLTVKQLTDIAPYSSDDPELPVVYNVEKRTGMYIVDAATGKVIKDFGPGDTFLSDDSCAPVTRNYFGSRDRTCRGIIDIGQTVYTITIHNKKTNEHVCTIRYAEWNPNSRDKDLQAQYGQTMDNQYIYSRYDGEVFSYDHSRSRWRQRPVFQTPLPYPVARVFDIARPTHDDSAEAPLVLLPQPAGPAFREEMANRVLLNTTDTGAWYALSEIHYPAVTDGAPEAACYQPKEYLDWDAHYILPDTQSLIGVHELDRLPPQQSQLRAIAAPTQFQNKNEHVQSTAPAESLREQPHQAIDPPPQPMMEPRSLQPYWLAFTTLIVIVGCIVTYKKTELAQDYFSRLYNKYQGDEPLSPEPAAVESKVEPNEQKDLATENFKPEMADVTVTVAEAEAEEEEEAAAAAAETEEVKIEIPVPAEVKEKKVMFDIPDDDDDDLSPISRTTTMEQPSPSEESAEVGAVKSTGESQQPSTAASTEDGGQDTNSAPATPKKKKTHRGKRGGRKLNRNQQKDDDEVNRIVNAAKQLEVGQGLHPDEVTMNGDDIQDVSNIKRIGKLTIDQDKLLGNGSGGTFVFEGKWNEREVAVKRMLPQYFGLAEQEVKLLQESDLHPNVIRYFDDEKDENFLYIAVELCQASLFDLYKDGRPGEELTPTQQRLVHDINLHARQALYQLANGLNHLHSLRIIHRDIKPQNILIAHPQRTQKAGIRLVISDFGLCKTLPDNVSTLIGTTGNAGTVGWKAPELISQPKELANGSSQGFSRDSSSSTDPVAQGVKRAVDIFSLGCVFFYVLTNGCHPFDDDEGWMQIREYNIKKEKANLKQLRLGDDSEEPYHLIKWMLKTRPEDRPTAIQVMNHPFFWSDEKRLNFLCDCSDHWEREPRDPPSEMLSALEDYSSEVLDAKRNFLAKLDHGFINSLGKQRKYTGDRMLDLLRALRNKKNHYEDMEESVKLKVGPLPSGYLRYWTVRFPRLLMACYECVVECGLQGESRFRPYFEGQSM
ncbi:hypothetical protein IAQ61_001672 [Plenodomus lingam]|uniref:non-specific serine/threonine protein kinase n=1 Tax=Leptosphaeria maculans (strain JN3 / isolate v23.1.3 / race Av1-4-5-6-7-8) TaxID=985895 RepID=E4ZFV3_LEPMJ|nr:hypothetical protein LEMA_P062990.1 [Plenodomus lingam JN3]KAH9878400.1 hypothetical protein IAQ61_001672 [Plenodomus lingam]CBX90173.1 hypothetical protein LEMA_P062990.1 [Plenodomus lingam JN3]